MDLPLSLTFNKPTDDDQVLFAGNSSVKEVILNRPRKLNVLNLEMISQITKKLILYENDPSAKLVILKGNGKAFCAGGDLISSVVGQPMSYVGSYYKKLFNLVHLTATYKKPLVSLMNGIVMGSGAGISMNTNFRIVTEKTVFAMPEVSIGLYPDVSASYFLSRLPGYFGEYLGLSGAKLDGEEMVACGLATHFVPSKIWSHIFGLIAKLVLYFWLRSRSGLISLQKDDDQLIVDPFAKRLKLLENALQSVKTSDISIIASLIDKFTEIPCLKKDSPLTRLQIIDECFSKGSVEQIILSLENIMENNGAEEKWIIDALNYMRSSCPMSLKIFLRSVREGRTQNIAKCLSREYIITSHFARRTVSNDLFEGIRAKLIDKDNKPKWEPSKLELVSEEMVDQYFKRADDKDWDYLQHFNRSNLQSKL